MTATDELRRMLDERGVGHEDTANTTVWEGSDGARHMASHVYPRGSTRPSDERLVLMCNATPEQAVAVTLGRGECRNESKVMDEHGQARFACSECGAWIDSRMLWNPEYRNGESPWVNDCKLNFCPNCGRKVVTNG